MQNWSYYGRSLAPCVSTVHLPDVTACDQISQAIPFCNCKLQVIKDWRWEQPGNKAKLTPLHTASNLIPLRIVSTLTPLHIVGNKLATRHLSTMLET